MEKTGGFLRLLVILWVRIWAAQIGLDETVKEDTECVHLGRIGEQVESFIVHSSNYP